MEKWIIVLPGWEYIGPYGSRESAERRLADHIAKNPSRNRNTGRVVRLLSDTARFGKPVGNTTNH